MLEIIYPLDGIGTTPGIGLSQHFGEHPEVYAQFNLKGHDGIDWMAPVGTPIRAVHDGFVVYDTETQNYGTGYGMDVRLFADLDGFTYEFTYAHLSEFEGVSRDVKQGEIIGYTGNTGFSTGPHLHLGGRKRTGGRTGPVVDYNNGFFGYFDLAPYFKKGDSMKLVQDNGTVYLVAGIAKKVKWGIAQADILNSFGDEPIEQGSTAGIPEINIATTDAFVVRKV